jgi:hypothetical protein
LACSLPLPRRASPICGGSRSLLGKGLAPILLVVAHIFTGASLLYNSGTRISCAPLLANYNGALGLDVRHSYSWGGWKILSTVTSCAQSLRQKGLPVTGVFSALLTIEAGDTSMHPLVIVTSDGHF